MTGLPGTDKSPHVRQPCAAEVNEYWNERTFGPFCSHPLSKLVFIVIIYGDGRARLPNIVMYSSRSTLSGACFSRSLLLHRGEILASLIY